MWTKNIIAWSIPDMPKFLHRLMQRENYITNEVIMERELDRAKKIGGACVCACVCVRVCVCACEGERDEDSRNHDCIISIHRRFS